MRATRSSERVRSTTLISSAGLQVTVLDVGATLQSVILPTTQGPLNCILGYANPEDYLHDPYYIGATLGRCANRIGGASFCIDDVRYSLDINETRTGNCLHGGSEGLHRQRFVVEHIAQAEGVVCHLESPDGAMGFPGNVKIDVIYRIVGDFAFSIEFVATTDIETIVNLASHPYFNLSFADERIDSHQLQVEADYFTPVDDKQIPSGELLAVDNSKFDLREMMTLDGASYDYNFALTEAAGELKVAAELYSPESGVRLTLRSTQAGLHVYTGDYLDAPFEPRQGIALEAQGFPDAANKPDFPSVRLLPGETYRQQTVYEFSLPDPRND